MGFGNNRVAKITGVTIKSDKFAFVFIKTDKGVNGAYEQDFYGETRFMGKAYDKVKDLKYKCFVRLLDTEVKRSYNAEHKVSYYSFNVYDFDFVNRGATKNVELVRNQSRILKGNPPNVGTPLLSEDEFLSRVKPNTDLF